MNTTMVPTWINIHMSELVHLARNLQISYIVIEDAQLKCHFYFDCFCQRCCEENESSGAVCENKIFDL